MEVDRSGRREDLHAAVAEVLHYLWDPIGVRGIPQARDEYDGYVAGVVGLLESDAAVPVISEHLQQLAEEWMGLPRHADRANEVAAVLVEWREFFARDRD